MEEDQARINIIRIKLLDIFKTCVIEGELLVPSETGDVTLASQDDKSKTHYSEENAVYNTK